MVVLPGGYVFSKAGRDRGKCLAVIGVDGDYLLLVDGKARKMQSPKRKKRKHVRPSGYIDEQLSKKLSGGLWISDREVRRRIALYLSENSPAGAEKGGHWLGKR